MVLSNKLPQNCLKINDSLSSLMVSVGPEFGKNSDGCCHLGLMQLQSSEGSTGAKATL